MKLRWQAIAAIFVLAGPVSGWTGYMLADTNPPYVRDRGQILATDPAQCNKEPDGTLGRIAPGACVVVKWDITVDQKRMADCDVASTEHVGRTITDANGVHALPKTRNTYGGDTGRAIEHPLIRAFILPEWSIEGPATYWSEARFVCNPLQRMFPEQLARRINEPVIPYYVEASGAPR